MTTKDIKAPPAPGMPKTYAELVRLLPLKPIRNDEELDRSHEMLGRLVGFSLNVEHEDYMEALAILTEAYEDEHYPIDTSHITPLSMLQFLMEQQDMTASDLGRLLGNRSLGSAILTGRRQLSKAHILKLAERFKVDAGLFLKPDAPPGRRKRPSKPVRTLRGTRRPDRAAAR